MANCILSFDNKVLSYRTQITPYTHEVSGLGINRVKDPQIRRRWRTPSGDTSPTVDFDFGVPIDADVIAWVQPDNAGGWDGDGLPMGICANTDLIRHLLDLGDPFPLNLFGTAYDSANVQMNTKVGFGVHCHLLPSTTNFRYMRTSFSCPSLNGTVGYLDMGLVWVGKTFKPTYNMAYGYNWFFSDTSTITNVQTSGLDFVSVGPKRRNIVFGFDALTDDEADIVSQMQRAVGNSKQVLFIPDPDDLTSDFGQPIVGRLVNADPIALPSVNRFTKSFTLIQSL